MSLTILSYEAFEVKSSKVLLFKQKKKIFHGLNKHFDVETVIKFTNYKQSVYSLLQNSPSLTGCIHLI